MKLRVLIVDDAPFILEVLSAFLSENDVEIAGEALNGEEAVEMAHRLNPDLILMDLALPKMNGIQATKEIIKRNPSAKIIAMSSLADEQMQFKAMEAGCINFIDKKLEKPQLLEIIKSQKLLRSEAVGDVVNG